MNASNVVAAPITCIRTARQEVGQDIWRKQFELEEAIQLASERAAELSAELARAPKRANLARGYGQAVVTRTAQVVSCLAEARGACATAHEGLERARKDLGVELFWPFDDGGGETNSTPPDKPPPSGSAEVVPLNADAGA